MAQVCTSQQRYVSGMGSAQATPSPTAQVSKLLQYSPQKRMTAVEAMTHPFFDELREPGTKLPNGALTGPEAVCLHVGRG